MVLVSRFVGRRLNRKSERLQGRQFFLRTFNLNSQLMRDFSGTERSGVLIMQEQKNLQSKNRADLVLYKVPELFRNLRFRQQVVCP